MTRNIRNILFLLFVLCAQSLVAQDISVVSFRLLENDLTANTHGTMEKDFNGETAALIKVVTPEKGFVFDGGMVGIVRTKQMTGEVWVYVPYGIKKISIMHDNLGVLRDYYFPISIEKARTYEMKLTTGKTTIVVERKAGKQYVMFNVTPANAVVELDGMPLEVVDGYAEKSMAYGTYDYRVSCTNHHTEAGKLTVSSAGKVEKNIALRPNFGWIDLRATSDHHGAHVYIDGERIGQLPLKSDVLKSSTYKVKVLKPLYKPFEQQVTVTDNNTTTLNVVLVPNFANITLTTDAESEIWVDGRQRGKGKCTIGLEEGEYTVEVKRPSHRTVSDVITVPELTDRTIQLPSPTPIYGVLDVSSTPSRATVLVDGVEVGQTPLILDNVLVGSRKVTLKKEGYEPYEKTMVLTEDADNTLTATLEVEKPKFYNGAKKTYTVNGVSFTMVDVEGGTFTMGATSEQGSDAENDEKPAHKVTLSNYAIGETEVTQELWQAVMGSNPSHFKGDLQRPVEQVSWNDCQTFIKKLNQLTGENFRLPTEAEWEYAARGGKESRGYKYSGSNTLGGVAWCNSNSLSKTRAVKTKQPNELGIYDMSGNVWEWCSDWYSSSYYSSYSGKNPTGPSSGSHRVLRGGSWSSYARNCRVACRSSYSPDFRSRDYGLRLVLSVVDSEKNMEENYSMEKPKTPAFANGAKKTYTVKGVSFTMVDVEGGTFTMGATSEQGSDAENDEKPAHKVTLSNYSIGETEVTQELWQAVMGRNPSNFIGNMQRPVEQVSWNECQTFIKKLNKLTGENFRLPTEAEWEFAARGGSVSKGYKYSGSNTIGDVAWFNKNSSAVHVVKSKQPNELGIYDMSGNVWEWCADKYGSYTSSAQTAPTGSSSGSDRVIRGGSWGYDEGNCRVSNRENCSPDSRGSSIGFRLALQFIP